MIDALISMFQKPVDSDNDGYKYKHKNYERLRPEKQEEIYFKHPIARHVLNAVIVNKDDFIKFVNEYKTDRTKIFYNERSISAVFNYSTAADADYGDSYAKMNLERTKEFDVFAQRVDIDLSQGEFVEMLKTLERFIIEFDDKSIDDMDIIEIAENLQATTNIHSVQRNTKQSFVLDAEVKSGSSTISVPRFITFKIPIYRNDRSILSKFRTELFMSVHDNDFNVRLACYTFDESLEEAAREITQTVVDACKGIDSYMV